MAILRENKILPQKVTSPLPRKQLITRGGVINHSKVTAQNDCLPFGRYRNIAEIAALLLFFMCNKTNWSAAQIMVFSDFLILPGRSRTLNNTAQTLRLAYLHNEMPSVNNSN